MYHFFLLWGYDFAYRRRVVSLRQPHTLTKLDKAAADEAWPRRRDEQALMLEDPIETQRDLGRLVGKHALQAIRLEAAWAAIRLSGGASLEQLCEPFDWRLRPYASLLGHERLEAEERAQRVVAQREPRQVLQGKASKGKKDVGEIINK